MTEGSGGWRRQVEGEQGKERAELRCGERESINQTYGVIAGGVTLRPPPPRSRGDWSAERATEGSERGGGRACAGNDLRRRRAAHEHVSKSPKV